MESAAFRFITAQLLLSIKGIRVMKYRDYAILSFCVLLIELAISSLIYRIDALFFSVYTPLDWNHTWAYSVDKSYLTPTLAVTVAVFLIFVYKSIKEMNK